MSTGKYDMMWHCRVNMLMCVKYIIYHVRRLSLTLGHANIGYLANKVQVCRIITSSVSI